MIYKRGRTGWMTGHRAFWSPMLFSAICLCMGAAQWARADGIVPGHVVLMTQPNVDIQQLAADYNTTVLNATFAANLYGLNLPNNTTEKKFAKKLKKDSRVIWSEPDTFAGAAETQFNQQFHFAFDGGSDPGNYQNQFAYQQVDFGNAANYSTGAGIVVAVMDTGATFSHPALQGHYLPGYNFLSPGNPPDDVPDGTTNYAVGHGTMVAGIVAFLAPDAKIMPLRVLNGDGLGTAVNVAQALHYAVVNGVQVINMSFGSHSKSSLLNAAIGEAQGAGIILVAAAGNDGANSVQYPAASGTTIAVASVESDNTKSSWSSYGSFIGVVAPGDGIRSTYYTGGYANWSGTSFAAPFVASEAALILAANPPIKQNPITVIRNTAHSVDGVNQAYRHKLGKGIIDIQSAVMGKHH